MASPSATELALRAAVNMNSRDLSSAGDHGESISGTAIQRAGGLLSAGKMGSSLTPGLSSLETEAIMGAVAVVGLAYTAVVHVMGVRDDVRATYDRERESGIATFDIPRNREEKKLTKEVKVIKGILDLALRRSSFATYLGVHSSVLPTSQEDTFYSVLPFYRMSESLNQPLASTRAIDRQRTAIGLFLKSALPDAIAEIDMSFQKDNELKSFFQAGFQRKNYLNDRRAPRFVMVMLANLLWNLQHPVDLETGFPLELNHCISLCRDVEAFLNQLLDPSSPPYLENIDNHENEIMCFVRKLEIYTKTLKAAYVEEQLNELNFGEIADCAHRALRIMDQSLFKLIFTVDNPLTQKQEPDGRAAETMADTISYLNLLLRENPELVNALTLVPTWMEQPPGMNIPPQTTLDVLILFSHLSCQERDNYLSKFEDSCISTEIQFVNALRKFDKKFIKPIKAVSKKELNATPTGSKHEAVGRLTAQRLVPLITLVVEDYKLDVDTPLTYLRAKKSLENSSLPKFISGKQQAVAINQSAMTGAGYYQWALAPFTGGATELDDLPKYQYRMTQVTKLIDSVGELVQNYRSFLLQKSFQNFLKECLKRVKEEIQALEKRIADTDLSLEHNERISKSLKSTLFPMTAELEGSLSAFALATANFEHVVSAPDFTDQQKQLLSSKVETISSQFSMLFGADSGLSHLVDSPQMVPITTEASTPTEARPHQPEPRLTPHLSKDVGPGQVIALRGLIQGCFNALSPQSKYGHKGLLLRELLGLIGGQVHFTETQICEVLMELIRVTASSRGTWFFQAAYGQTRSAKALMTAVKDRELNEMLPVARILFDDPQVNVMQLTEEKIHRRIMMLHDANRQWQEPSECMRVNYAC
ncbi:MAG: hypothetical protein NTW94_04545 [Legionellales bacterium]|nr:hypothetical protein [Legionellales bacterium]